jgi:hypothetical protein
MRKLASAIIRNRIETFLNILRRPEVEGEKVQQITQHEMLAASSGGCSDHRRPAYGPNGPCREILASVTSHRMFDLQNGRLKTKEGPAREIGLRSQHYAIMHAQLPGLARKSDGGSAADGDLGGHIPFGDLPDVNCLGARLSRISSARKSGRVSTRGPRGDLLARKSL